MTGTGLEDHHLIVLAQLLTTSKVKSFSFAFNKIQSQGFLEFTRQIPKMHSLRKTVFSFNRFNYPGTSTCEIMEESGKALLHAIKENPSLTDLETCDFENFPQCSLICYQLFWNHCLQRFLEISKPSRRQGLQFNPDGLWPHILEGLRPEMLVPDCDDPFRYKRIEPHMYDPDAVYFFLKKCPSILAYRTTGSNK